MAKKKKKRWLFMTEQEINRIKMERCICCKYHVGHLIGVTGCHEVQCNYLAVTGHSRGCRPEDCEHYKEGKGHG